jgi:hypothetical protein
MLQDVKNNDLYEKILPQMKKSLKKIPENGEQNNSYKSWLLGRVLLAASDVQDKPTMNELQPNLENLLKNNATTKDEYSAWGWGYLAALDETTYNNNKEEMFKASANLTKPGDALWAYVMDLQAAAKAKKKEDFYRIINHIKEIAQQDSLAASLTNGISQDDYQPWAIAIARRAGANIGDHDLYHQLKKPYEDSLKQAQAEKRNVAALLAELNNFIAEKETQEKEMKVNITHGK